MKQRRPRRGLETAILRREQGLYALRMHVAGKMSDVIDATVLERARGSALEAMKFHMASCAALLRDIRDFQPTFFDVRTRAFLPLTRTALLERREAASRMSEHHAIEKQRTKSRRAKNA